MKDKEIKFETLKKSYKKQIIIGAVAVCVIGGAFTFATSRAKYRLDGTIDIAKGTVNYKPYDFKIMAMYQSDDGNTYNEIETMPESGYVINEDKTYCTTDNKTKVKGKIKTENGKHYITGLAKSDKCYLWFDKKTTETVATAIGNIEVKLSNPDFSKTAPNDIEGIFAVEDGMYGGTSYYWRGAVENNYLKFANFCWRIIRINGDGSIRLIYDGSTCHENGTNTAESIAVSGVAYNINFNQSNYVGWTYEGTSQRTLSGTNSNIKTQLENWYNTNITGTNASKVEQGKYCNDRNVGAAPSDWSGYVTTWGINGTKFAYAGAKRLYESYAPTLSCLTGDVYTLSVGLITADEVEFAGGKNENNTSYYLYNGQYYWTMSPYNWNGAIAYVFSVSDDGNLYSNSYVSYSSGVRPVINLKSEDLSISGSGSISDPYVAL